jgi:hypothetical protein
LLDWGARSEGDVEPCPSATNLLPSSSRPRLRNLDPTWSQAHWYHPDTYALLFTFNLNPFFNQLSNHFQSLLCVTADESKIWALERCQTGVTVDIIVWTLTPFISSYLRRTFSGAISTKVQINRIILQLFAPREFAGLHYTFACFSC